MTTRTSLTAFLTVLAVILLAVDPAGPQTRPAATVAMAPIQDLHPAPARNAAPSAPDATIQLTTPGVYQGTLPGADPDGDPVTFELIRANGPFDLVDPASGKFTYTTPPDADLRTARVVYRVIDADGLDDLATLTVRSAAATRYRR
jgi:hypothetical protein